MHTGSELEADWKQNGSVMEAEWKQNGSGLEADWKEKLISADSFAKRETDSFYECAKWQKYFTLPYICTYTICLWYAVSPLALTRL